MTIEDVKGLPPVSPKERFGAAIYEPFLWLGERRGMRARRERLLSQARGRVVEIGAGTGLNAELYPLDAEELILTEPVEGMCRKLRKRAVRVPRAKVMVAKGNELPAEDGSVDTVVSTLVLCTVPEVDPVLAEIARVLRPGGRLLFCEHVRDDDSRSAAKQDRIAPRWAAFAQGCQCNRDTEVVLRQRFDFEWIRYEQWRGMPSLVRPLVVGSAIRKS